jgi:hypothetical protein
LATNDIYYSLQSTGQRINNRDLLIVCRLLEIDFLAARPWFFLVKTRYPHLFTFSARQQLLANLVFTITRDVVKPRLIGHRGMF